MYARQAITTRYLGPTNNRGARVKATADAGSVTLDWDHALDMLPNHAAAAKALAAKFSWTGEYHAGGLAQSSKDAYVFVCVGGYDTLAFAPKETHDRLLASKE